MSENCIFCQIASKTKAASLVYEDGNVVAFLDVRPVSEGHTLVVPKRHYDMIYMVPDEQIAHLFTVVKKVACAVQKAMNADGISIFQNNGKASGQVIFHFHVHIIPRYEGQTSRRAAFDEGRQNLDTVAEKIRQHL